MIPFPPRPKLITSKCVLYYHLYYKNEHHQLSLFHFDWNMSMIKDDSIPASPLYTVSREKLLSAPSFLGPFHQPGWYPCPEPRKISTSSDPRADMGAAFPRWR